MLIADVRYWVNTFSLPLPSHADKDDTSVDTAIQVIASPNFTAQFIQITGAGI